MFAVALGVDWLVDGTGSVVFSNDGFTARENDRAVMKIRNKTWLLSDTYSYFIVCVIFYRPLASRHCIHFMDLLTVLGFVTPGSFHCA